MRSQTLTLFAIVRVFNVFIIKHLYKPSEDIKQTAQYQFINQISNIIFKAPFG